MRSIQQANQGQAPIGIKQIDTQIQKVKSELKIEQSQAFERTMREAKINKDTAQVLSQRVEKLQEEKDKYKKQADEILKRTEGPGIHRSSIHSNRSQKIDNDKFTQDQIKQREILALELEMNQKEKQFLAEIENLKMDIKQLTHDLNEAWSENDQKDKQIEQLQTQNSLLQKEKLELQKKLMEEKSIQKKQQSPQKIIEPQNNLINENSAIIEKLKKQIQELQEEISEYDETINSHQQEILEWKNKFSQLQKNKDEVDNYYAIAYNEIQNLLASKEEMENQRKDDKNNINQLEATIIVLKNNLNEFENNNKRLQDQIDIIQKNNQDLRAENLKQFELLASKPLEVNSNLQNDLIELHNAPSNSNGGEEFISQFNQLSDDFQNLKSKYTEVLEQKQTMENENNKKAKENSLLNDAIKKLENRIKSQEGEIQDWINKYNSKNTELNAILEQENNDKLKIEELELHIKDQEIKINDLEIALKYSQKDSTPRNKDNNNTFKQRELEDKLKQANVQINDLKKEIQSLQQQQNKQDEQNEQDLNQLTSDLEKQNNKLKLDNDKLISQLNDAEKKISDQDQIIKQQKKQQEELEQKQKQIPKSNPSESNQEQEALIERLNQSNEQLEVNNSQLMKELNLIKNKNSKNLRSKFILVGKLMQIEKLKSDQEEKIKKQKAIINELLGNQKNQKTEKENSSDPIPQVNEPQIEQQAENELDTHQNIQEELVKQKQRNQKLLGKIFRILTKQKQKDAIITQLEERIEKQKAINQELIENQKNSEQQPKLNEEVKQQNEVEHGHEQPQIQDNQNQQEQKNELLKLKTQNQKLLSKILRIMTKLKIKEDELQNLNERLKKQQAINDAIDIEPKEKEEVQPEQEQLIVDDQQNNKQINMEVENKDVDHDQMKIKNQNQRLQGKLFRTMFLLNKKNNEIESLLQRSQKQKAQIEVLNNQIHENNINSNQIKDQEKEPNFNLQNSQQEQPQQDLNSNEIEKQNDVLRNQKINKMAAKLFMIMSKYNKQNKLIENLNERLSKYKAIIESQSQENQQSQAENINITDVKLENDKTSTQQQMELQNANEQDNVRLRNQNNKLLVKLFRVMSGLTRKNNQIQLLEQRLTKQKAIIDSLTQEQATNQEVQEQSNHPNKDNQNIQPNSESQEQQINHQNEISIWKYKYNKLLAKLFRILSQQKKKDKELIQLNERLNIQKAINDQLMVETNQDAQIKLEPELHHQEISLQAASDINPEKQSEIFNNNEFLKIKNQNAKALSKLFRLSFLLQKQNKENKQLNDRLVKQNAIIEEFSKIQNSSHQLKVKNGKLLAKLFILTSNLNMQNKANEDLERKLLQKNAQLKQLVENYQQEEKNSQMDLLQQQPEQKQDHNEQSQNENSKLEIQRLENQNKKYLAKIFKLLCQMFQKERENDQLLKRLSKQKAIVQDLIDNQNYYEQQTDEGVENIEPQQVGADNISQNNLQKLQKTNAKMLAKQFKLLFTIKKLENQLENAQQRLQKQKQINLQSLEKIDEQEIKLEQLQEQIQVLKDGLQQQQQLQDNVNPLVETNQDYYKTKYNNLLEEHLHLLNVGDLINEQEKQLRKEFRQQLEEEKLKAKDLFNNLLNEHLKLQEECEKAIDSLNSANQNQDQLVDKSELETIKNKFNSLLSEHLALEELNDGLNKKQDDIKQDHEKQLDDEIQKQKEKYNKLLNQYLLLEMQRDGILQEQSPKLENQLDLDKDDDVVEKKQQQVHNLNTDEQQINLFGAQGEENSPQLEEIWNYKQQLSDLQSQILSLNEEKEQLQKINLQLTEQLNQIQSQSNLKSSQTLDKLVGIKDELPNSTNQQSQERFNKENDVIEKQGLELAQQRQELLTAQEQKRNQEILIAKIEKDKELLENECHQLKTQVDDLQSKLENYEQKLNEKTAHFVQTMEQLLKENQDDFEENKQLIILNQATQPVIQILKKLQHDQELKQSRKQSQELQSTQENQQEIIYLKHYIKTLEDNKQQYSDGISILNRRIIELFNKNSLLQKQIQQLNQQSQNN